jgi:hypothetical protein
MIIQECVESDVCMCICIVSTKVTVPCKGQHVGSAGSEPSLSDLEDQLDLAVAAEDYARAARLRDSIDNAKHDDAVAVLHANSQFYKAFARCNKEAMGRIWGDGLHVQCCHPGLGILVGGSSPLLKI